MGSSDDREARDRRTTSRDRRRSLHDRRMHGVRFTPPGPIGRTIRWATGPWTSANGLSWFRLVILIAIVRWGFLAVYTIPSSSMEPTLHGDPRFAHGDRVAVNKLAFGPRIPFTKTRLFTTGKPKRWDIVVFDTVEPGVTEPYLIKRIVGLPGERVQIRGPGSLLAGEPELRINGDVVEPPEELKGALNYLPTLSATNAVVQNFLLDFANHGQIPIELSRSKDERIRILRKDLKALHADVADLAYWELSQEEKSAMLRDVRPESREVVHEWWTDKVSSVGRPRYGVLFSAFYASVPEGHYFCLGDNGPESIDSRFFGWVPEENMVGRAFAVAYPPARIQDLSGFSKTPFGALMLFGLTGLVILWEVVPGFCVFGWKLRAPIPALGLQRGDHVLINRIAYGLRLPFSNRRVWWRQLPKPGEVVCYSLSRDVRHRMDLYFGEIRETNSDSDLLYSVRGPGNDGQRWLALGRDDIIGRVQSIWWPPSRRSPVQTTGNSED